MVSFIELENNLGTIVTLCNIGASIYDIKTKGCNNLNESILYTTANMNDFPNNTSYLGKTIGRTGGRIKNGEFELNGVKYKIPSNDPNGLHGGTEGLSFKPFIYKKSKLKDYTEVIFFYESKNMESGYPGNLELEVIYRLYNEENKLTINYKGTTDKDTLLNLSNHAYFNLSGNAKTDILGHELYINSSKMELLEDMIPAKIVEEKEIYSFKKPHLIGDYINDAEIVNAANGYDFPYIFDDNKDFNVVLKDKTSKRVLKIKTTYPTVVVYTCNYTDDSIMNNNKVMTKNYAVCLECMYHPNTINSDFLKEKKDILRKDSTYNETIELYFEVENE